VKRELFKGNVPISMSLQLPVTLNFLQIRAMGNTFVHSMNQPLA
jgi:hypothetical protein